MKSLAAALGTVLCLTACAQHATTTSGTAAGASATPASAAMPGAAAPATETGPKIVAPGTAAVTPAAQRPATHRPVARVRSTAQPVPAVAPQILGASVSPTVVGSGSVVSAVVRTTPGVVSVVAYAGGTSISVPRVGPGLCEGSTTLPPLPPFAHGGYAVTFVARDARGHRTQSAVGVTVR